MGEQNLGSSKNLGQKLQEFESRPERERTRVDYLIVCGQGPVQDKYEKKKASESSFDQLLYFLEFHGWPEIRQEMAGQIREENKRYVEANSWMKFIAYAAGEIYKKGLAGKIVLTGGTTGGEGFPSEAELMKRILMERYKVPEEDIIVEDKAANTLQNFSYSINTVEQYSGGITEKTTFGVLAADFHAERVFLLASMFGIPPKEVYSAEETLLRFWDNLSEGSKKFLLARVTPAEAESLGLFDLEAKGQERKTIRQRGYEERRYTANLIEVPAYWVGYIGLLNNEQRIREILSNLEKDNPGLLKKMGIDLGADITVIRETLRPYTIMLSQGGKREMRFEGVSVTGIVPEELMGKIRIKIPEGLPVLRSVYH